MIHCGGCVYWAPMSGEEGRGTSKFGYCHRHAPSPLSAEPASWRWPITSRIGWCGEGRAKEGGKDGHTNQGGAVKGR